MDEVKPGLRLLLPSVALIVVTTMIPSELRHPSLHYIAFSYDPQDFRNNILLYMPLGMALGGSSLARALLYGLCLSTTAELLQIGYIDRVPSPLDVFSNTCGAVAGYLAARLILRATGYNPRSLRIPRPVAAAAMAVAILGAVALVRHHPVSDFSNWSPDAHLTLGQEPGVNYAWNGSVSELQIYPFAMAPGTIHSLACAAPPFGGLLPSVDLTRPYGRSLLSREEEGALYQALVKQNRLTLLVCLNSHDLATPDMARIVTYSRDQSQRNFTLGQLGDTLIFRLRTPSTGPNGHDPALHSSPVLTANHAEFVAAVYDGRISRLYVDGQLAAQEDLGARQPHLPDRLFSWLPQPLPKREIELGIVEALLSGLLAAGALGFFGVPHTWLLRAIAGIAAGAVIGGIVWTFGVSEAQTGMRILLESVASGLTIAVSMQPAPVPVAQSDRRLTPV